MSIDSLPVSDGQPPSSPSPTRVQLFNDRYGALAYEELLQLFERPCVTYAEIAERFGVTRECVRQWHLTMATGSPRGHERRRLCQRYQQRRRLLDDPVYRAFVRAAREQHPNLRVQPVKTKSGFRKRLVRLGLTTIALKRAGRPRHRSEARAAEFDFAGSSGTAEFVFLHLDANAYLFLPRHVIPRGGSTFLDVPGSKYYAFKNTLALPATVGLPATNTADVHDTVIDRQEWRP